MPQASFPLHGTKITYKDQQLLVGDQPIILYIEGDGIGVDVTPAMLQVVDAAVKKSYGGRRKINWHEIYAGEKAHQQTGSWLPQHTIDLLRTYKVGIKGPLTTPIGGGIRSLNVALRQQLDLYQCVRPIRYFSGIQSPVKQPQLVDMVIFRENSEDIYAGIEWAAGSDEAQKVIDFLQQQMQVTAIRFPEQCGIGIKPVSQAGTERLVRKALQYALEQNRRSVTVVHKGNIMKYTEGAFQKWAFELAQKEFGASLYEGGPWLQIDRRGQQPLIIKDAIADAFLQNILLRPDEFDVIATLNLNGDYISDALAAMVGGIGIAPGANIGEEIALFEATHGTAPKYAGLDKVNPGSLILSAEMMLRYMGWQEAADLIIQALDNLFKKSIMTYDLARMMNQATEVSCSGFAQAMIDEWT